MLNFPYWVLLWNKRKNSDLGLNKNYHQWVYSSDDILNKDLSFAFIVYMVMVFTFLH